MAGLQKDWEKQRLYSWMTHKKSFLYQEPEEGAATPQETEPDLTATVGWSPGEAWVISGLSQGRRLWQQQS